MRKIKDNKTLRDLVNCLIEVTMFGSLWTCRTFFKEKEDVRLA